jgi:hypothetical protein
LLLLLPFSVQSRFALRLVLFVSPEWIAFLSFWGAFLSVANFLVFCLASFSVLVFPSKCFPLDRDKIHGLMDKSVIFLPDCGFFPPRIVAWTAMGDRRRTRRSLSGKHFVTHRPNGILSPFYSGEPSIDPAANRSAETDLVELLWHNGGVVAQPQTHPRPAANPCGGQSASGLTGEETAAWFGDVDGLENEMYAQL